MANTSALHVDPAKFTIFDCDLSDGSDSEFDPEEWVSVTATSTTSTVSTLPRHLVLNPKSHSARFPAQIRYPSSAGSPAAPRPAVQPDEASMPGAFPESGPHLASSLVKVPGALLQSRLPSLKAIYLVTRASLSSYASKSHVVSHIFLPPTSPIQIHTPNGMEQYIRLCADCASPPQPIYCDGSWRSQGTNFCDYHAGCLKASSMKGESGAGNGRCAYPQGDGRAPACCARGSADGNRELAMMVINAVQPWWRAQTEKAGVRVFDLPNSRLNDSSVKHGEGCNCAGESLDWVRL